MLSLKDHSSAFRAFVAELQERNTLTVVGAGFLISIQLLVILFLSKDGSVLYLAGFAVILIFVQIFARYPKIWIHTVLLGSLVYFTFESPDVNIIEVLFGVFYLGGIIVWFVWQVMIRKRKIVRHIGDWLVLFFVALSITNVLIATLNDVPPIWWLREWNIVLLILYYFPIRENFSTLSDIRKLMFSAAVLVSGLCMFLIYRYYLMISKGIVYAYQYQGGSAATIEATFMAGAIFGVFATIFMASGKKRIWVILYTGLTIGTLLITFRRTFWLVSIVSIFLATPYLRLEHQKRLVKYVLLAAGIVLASSFAILGPKGSGLFLSVAAKRFESVGKGTKDISLYARYVESQEAIQQVREYPLSGSGMKSQIAFYEPILRHTKHNSYIHNGYIGSLHKIGIPLTILFFLPFIYFLVIGFQNVLHSKSLPPLVQIISFGSFFVLIGVLTASFTISQFAQRSGMLIIGFCIACIEITRTYRNKPNVSVVDRLQNDTD